MPAWFIVDDRVVVGVPVAVPGQQVTWLRDQGVGGDEFSALILIMESLKFMDN